MNAWHYLKPLKRASCPGQIIVAGLECNAVDDDGPLPARAVTLKSWTMAVHRVRKWGSKSRSVVSGTSAEEFWCAVESRCYAKQSTWLVVFHAPTALSLLNLEDAISSGLFTNYAAEEQRGDCSEGATGYSWKGSLTLEDACTIIGLRCCDDGAPLTILDIRNWFRMDLDSLFASFCHGDIKVNGKLMCQTEEAGPGTRIMEVLERAMLRLMETVHQGKLGRLSYGAAGQAMSAFRYGRLKHAILIHRDPVAIDCERRAYFGGLCRLWRHGEVKGPIHVLDFSSYYGIIMSLFRCPAEYLPGCKQLPTNEVDMLNSHLWYVAEVTVHCCSLPLPVRVGHKTVWAVGEFRTVLHTPELALALTMGFVKEIHCVHVYRAEKCFGYFGKSLLSMRAQAKLQRCDWAELVIKLVTNSLPGKFGSKGGQWEESPSTVPCRPTGLWTVIDRNRHEVAKYRSVAWRVQRKRLRSYSDDNDSIKGEGYDESEDVLRWETAYSCPSIAGAITSWGRFGLIRLISCIGEDNIYYCDTDCVHCNDAGLARLSDWCIGEHMEMAGPRLVSSHQIAHYYGPRHYSLDGSLTMAGIKSTAIFSGPNSVVQDSLPSWATVIDRHMPDMVYSESRELLINGYYCGGVPVADGRVLPVNLQG